MPVLLSQYTERHKQLGLERALTKEPAFHASMPPAFTMACSSSDSTVLNPGFLRDSSPRRGKRNIADKQINHHAGSVWPAPLKADVVSASVADEKSHLAFGISSALLTVVTFLPKVRYQSP